MSLRGPTRRWRLACEGLKCAEWRRQKARQAARERHAEKWARQAARERHAEEWAQQAARERHAEEWARQAARERHAEEWARRAVRVQLAVGHVRLGRPRLRCGE